MKTKQFILTIRKWAALTAASLFILQGVSGAGTLKPVGSPNQPIEIRSHDVQVVINNGFAQTRVTQTFFNPNPQDMEAIYAFPVPEDAVLSEMRMVSGETTLEGEVVPKEKADEVYEEEKQKGNSAGKGEKQGYQHFEFHVTPVRSNEETRMEFVYYQKLEVDSNIGRYLYPMEEGGTDEQAKGFWDMNSTVTGTFSATVEVRSAYPVTDIRVPNFPGQSETLSDGHYRWTYSSGNGTALNTDLVAYYRLQDGIPARVDLLTYKTKDSDEGTFMLSLTPGTDLKPLDQGADYLLILDKSGSMAGKIQTLATGVERALGALSVKDRFRIVAFDDGARELTSGWINVNEQSVLQHIEQIRNLAADGSTNLFSGLKTGFKMLDSDRLTNVILVTDGVTNTGIVDPAAFDKLMRSHDIRLFGFLMGNSANWPLMRIICEASDGTYESISNGDDLYGKILMARDRITTEALLDVDLDISGVKTHSLARNTYRKLYRGKQLIVVGKYRKGGEADLTLKTKVTGEDRAYQTKVRFPETDESYPELERIWAMTLVENLERKRDLGQLPEGEFKQGIQDIGVDYQIVTDETSLILLDDQRFAEYGIDRHNQARMAREQAAQMARRSTAPAPVRADANQPMFQGASHSAGNGGGALEGPFVILLISSLFLLRKKRVTSLRK